MKTDEKFDTKLKAAPPKKNRLPENPDETSVGRFPKWLHRKLPKGGNLFRTGDIINEHKLNTVCEEAKCPNRLECYSKKTATFLALGSACTRACGFCDIDFTKTPIAPEADEPERIAKSARDLGLKHVVITMVARDDLPDKGAAHIAAIIRAIRELSPESTIEVLTSDFSGAHENLDLVLNEKPEVFNHNIETIRRLTPKVRHTATYDRTLALLEYVKKSGKAGFVKSGIMVGLGETNEEVEEVLRDLHNVGCDVVTIGQYLQAARLKLPVRRFVTPEEFESYVTYGKTIDLNHVYSGPFVRSSYNADALLGEMRGK